MKKFTVLFLAAAMTASLAACKTASADADSNGDGTQGSTQSEAAVSDLGYDRLIIGVDDTFAPMGFLDENNDLAGFDIDLAKAVGEKLGVEVEFQIIDWSMKEQELMQGNVDVLWNGYTITEERKDKGVIFTEPYLDNKQVVCVMADSGITSLADLAGKTVAAQAESSAIEAMAAMPQVSSTFSIAEFATNDMAIMDMEAGRSDAVVADSVLLEYVISHKDDPSQYVILDENFGSEEYGIGVRDQALCDAINGAVKALKADGTAAEISTKWFGADIVK